MKPACYKCLGWFLAGVLVGNTLMFLAIITPVGM